MKARETYEARFRPEATVRRLEEISRFAIEWPVWLEQNRPVHHSQDPTSQGVGSEGAALHGNRVRALPSHPRWRKIQ